MTCSRRPERAKASLWSGISRRRFFRRHGGLRGAALLLGLLCLGVGPSAPLVQQPELARPQPGPNNQLLPLFQPPFAGDFPLANFFDHDLPFEFQDTNGFQLTWWGERSVGLDGHNGYDWLLPEGTPVLAVADGVIAFAGESDPIPCPPLQSEPRELGVVIAHPVPGQEGALVIVSGYAHLNRVDAQVGQRVSQGQPIGLSGNTGCSTTPHLHLSTRRYDPRTDTAVLIDPYGWEGPGADPWAQHPEGAQSLWLWQANQAPALFREVRLPPNPFPGNHAPVAITRLRWMGWQDERNPNNEFVELTLDPRFAPAGELDLTGFSLRNDHGDTFRFPDGLRIRQDRPIRVFTGAGPNTPTELYWGRSSGAWDNMGDCARLVTPDGQSAYALTPSSCS